MKIGGKQVTWNIFGKTVQHPILVAIAMVGTLAGFIIALIFSPILVPLHFILRGCGLNGFYFNNCIWIGLDSFKRYVEPFDSTILGRGFRRI